MPHICHRQVPYRISIFPTRQSYMFLKPKAKTIVYIASGFLFVSNIKRSPFHSRNIGLFPFSQHSPQDSKDSVMLFMEIIYDCTWTFRQFCQAPFTTSGIPPAWSTHTRCIKTSFFIVLLVSYHYCSNSFISEPNNYLLGYVEVRKLVCTSRSNEKARISAVLLLHWFLGIERNGWELKCPPSENCSNGLWLSTKSFQKSCQNCRPSFKSRKQSDKLTLMTKCADAKISIFIC